MLHTFGAGTPDEDHALFEEILVECTAFQLAGALNEEAVREAVEFVTQALLQDVEAPQRAQSIAASSAQDLNAATLPVQHVSASESEPGFHLTPAAEPSVLVAAAHESRADYPSIPDAETSTDSAPSHADRIAAGADAHHLKKHKITALLPPTWYQRANI